MQEYSKNGCSAKGQGPVNLKSKLNFKIFQISLNFSVNKCSLKKLKNLIKLALTHLVGLEQDVWEKIDQKTQGGDQNLSKI